MSKQQKPHLTATARIFLAVNALVQKLMGRRNTISAARHVGAREYSEFEYNSRKEFVDKFPGGIGVHGKRLLDLGCGRGGETVGYAEEGARAVGVEISEQYLHDAAEYAREKLPDTPVEFLIGDGAALPFANDSFDVIVMHDVLEHLEKPAEVINECERVLAPGGRLYISFGPLWYSPFGGHVYYFSPLPWSHLYIPESIMFNARSKFRDDGARTYADAYIFKMSVKKFMRIIKHSNLQVDHLQLCASKGADRLAEIARTARAVLPRNPLRICKIRRMTTRQASIANDRRFT